ncbi:hypothetical protein [Spiroplasma taiwanense]|uniref:Uncharacterized protein n=1 Tax=Spiroplasma taiwanense CT-1 TaxID=1276220 RepID=S5MG98_9MOLU|nr:hypothetical protein [Spiroplasma taiwanense]AGR40885.1 hypothetical protein STAIW_v1c02080 [Spiroplasma taiwanense CT-1]
MIKTLIFLSNNSIFEKNKEFLRVHLKILEKNKIKLDNFFEEKMNKSLWIEIKELKQKILNKHDSNFEYFKELIAKTEDFADDMIVNLWAILAVNISYLEYLNSLVKG